MLQNAYLLAKIVADTAENEQHFAEILPKTGNYPKGRARASSELRRASWLQSRYATLSARQPLGALEPPEKTSCVKNWLWRHMAMEAHGYGGTA